MRELAACGTDSICVCAVWEAFGLGRLGLFFWGSLKPDSYKKRRGIQKTPACWDASEWVPIQHDSFGCLRNVLRAAGSKLKMRDNVWGETIPLVSVPALPSRVLSCRLSKGAGDKWEMGWSRSHDSSWYQWLGAAYEWFSGWQFLLPKRSPKSGFSRHILQNAACSRAWEAAKDPKLRYADETRV